MPLHRFSIILLYLFTPRITGLHSLHNYAAAKVFHNIISFIYPRNRWSWLFCCIGFPLHRFSITLLIYLPQESLILTVCINIPLHRFSITLLIYLPPESLVLITMPLQRFFITLLHLFTPGIAGPECLLNYSAA